MHQIATGLVDYGIPMQGIAMLILLTGLPHGRPRPDIIPACIQRYYDGITCLLHHRMINRNTGCCLERGTIQTDKIHILIRVRQGGLTSLQNSGLASGLALEMGKVSTMGLAPAVFGPLMNVTGSGLASWWRGGGGNRDF